MNSAYDCLKKVYVKKPKYQKYLDGAKVVFVSPRYTFGVDYKIDSMITMIDFKPDSLSFYAIAVSDSGGYFVISTDKGISKKWYEINLKLKQEGCFFNEKASRRANIMGYDPCNPEDYEDVFYIDFGKLDNKDRKSTMYKNISDYLSKTGNCFWFDVWGFSGLWVLDSSNHLSRITLENGRVVEEDGEEYYQKCLKKIGEREMRAMATGFSAWADQLDEESIVKYVGKD